MAQSAPRKKGAKVAHGVDQGKRSYEFIDNNQTPDGCGYIHLSVDGEVWAIIPYGDIEWAKGVGEAWSAQSVIRGMA